MKSNFRNIYNWSLGVLVSLWLIIPFLIGPLSLLFLLIVIYGIYSKELKFKFNFLLLGILLFFPFYMLYTFNTSHQQEAMFSLEKKLSFVIFPILFSFVPNFKVNRKLIEDLFLLAVFLLMGINFSYSITNYLIKEDIAFLFSSHFSPIHHPTYVAIFCALAIYLLFQKWKYASNIKEKSILVLGICFLLYSHFHLESLSGLLFVAALMAFLLLSWTYKKFGKIWFMATMFAGMIGLSFILFFAPSLRINLEDSFHFLQDYCKDPIAYTEVPRGEIRGNDARLILWTSSAEILVHHPNGIGVGNMDDILYNFLLKKGQINLAKEHLNPHNQYFHVALETGFLGLIFFVFLIKAIWYHGKRFNDGFLMCLACAFGFSCLFESMLERQSGIVFFVLFSCFLIGLHEVLKPHYNEA